MRGSIWAKVAAASTLLAGWVFLGIGIAVLGGAHGGFSSGVAFMLVGYGLIVCLVAVLGWFELPGGTGAMIAAGLLHLITAFSYARGPLWYWAALIGLLPLLTLVAAVKERLRQQQD